MAKPYIQHREEVKAEPMGKEKKHAEKPRRPQAKKKWEVNSIPYNPKYACTLFPQHVKQKQLKN